MSGTGHVEGERRSGSAAPRTAADDIDLTATEVNEDPDRFTDRALAGGPVQWSRSHGAWLLLDHQAVVEAFLDPRLSSDRTPTFQRQVARRGTGFARTAELLSGWMVFRDPPVHTHLREPVRRVFTPRMVEQLQSAIERTVDDLLAPLASVGQTELKAAYAAPLPALVIADLLGVPRRDRERFQAWSERLSEIVFSVGAEDEPMDEAAVIAATDEFVSFFGDLVEHRRRHPGPDLVSQVANGSGDQLTALQIIGACTLLLFAGHETTTELITGSVHSLFEHRGEIRRLLEDGVDATAADELVRLAGPVKTMFRKVAEAHERGGFRLERGATVYLVLLTANRDPAAFPDPHRLDLGRQPNPHVGFGWGRHLCLGANLARMEAMVALRRLYQTFPDLAPAGPSPHWEGNAVWRALPSLPLSLGAPAG